MIKLLWMIAIFTAAEFCARAELKDTTEGTAVHPAVTFLTNDISNRDIQDLLDVNAYHFKVHRSSETNGLAVSVEIYIEGKAPTTIAHLDMDRAMLDSERVGEDVPVFVAINPVGSLDGEGILSAKKLRCFLSEAVVKTSGTAENPFYKNEDGPVTWRYPARESANLFKFMEGNHGTNSASPKIELRIRFHEL